MLSWEIVEMNVRSFFSYSRIFIWVIEARWVIIERIAIRSWGSGRQMNIVKF